MESQEDSATINSRNIVTSVVQRMVEEVEKRVGNLRYFTMAAAALRTTATNSSSSNRQVRTESHQGGKGEEKRHTPVTSNVSMSSKKSTHGPKPKFINMPATDTSMVREKALEEMFEMGYDSDGELPCFGDMELEMEMMSTYAEIAARNEDEMPAPAQQPQEINQSAINFVEILEGAIMKMKVVELQQELKARNLSTTGKKDELQERLKKAMVDKTPIAGEISSEPVAQPKAFMSGAYWKKLDPCSDPVLDPTANTIFREPTNTQEVDGVKHYDFQDKFDRPVFINEFMEPVFDRFKRRKKDEDGNYQWTTTRVANERNGCANKMWLEEHDLTYMSEPFDFFHSFCPDSLTSQWTSYTNRKAWLENAGSEGHPYPDFTPFNPKEFRQHLGVRLLHGISPSPRIAMKFQSQQQNDVNGNDFVARSLGPNATRRHKHFRRFLACQNPVVPVPPRQKAPNFKVGEFLAHIIQVSMAAWICGMKISVDEQTIGFQGRHPDKLRITYKAEGDGFQCDALCNDGYTFSFYFRNEPPPPEYIAKGMSPLHARVLYLFDTLKQKYHRVGMDNLYISAKFARDCYTHPNKVLVHGVARKSGRGVPSIVLQDEITDRKAAEKVRGTVKAALLKGDTECPDLCAVSVYDTKPVHFLTMCNEKIEWVKKTRKVFNKEKKKVEKINFLRLNVNDDYNNGMGDVDVADQLRNHYRIDTWLRNYKWWHSLFWWGMQVLLTNSYIVYKSCLENAGCEPVSHYEYQISCAKAWIDPDIFGKSVRTPSDNASSTISTMSSTGSGGISTTTSRSATKKRKAYVSNKSMHPLKGKLRCRLDHSLDHWASEPPKDSNHNTPACQLHWWLCGTKKASNVARCPTCNVCLCVNKCYRLFHNEWDPTEKKDELKTVLVDSHKK